MYGHLFVQDAEGSRFSHCSDCGEEAEDVSLADGAAALPMPAVEKWSWEHQVGATATERLSDVPSKQAG